MESARTPARGSETLDRALLGVGAARGAEAVLAHPSDPAAAIDAAVGALHDTIDGIFPSVFVLEHGRLWLVSQRGYAVVPDGIRVESGIMGRAVRLGRAQLVTDVRADGGYVPALPGVRSELAVPLRAGRVVVGALNVECERILPERAATLVRPLAAALAPLAAELRAGRTLDLAGLARLFVYLGSLRDADEIAALAAASLPRILPVAASQVVVWREPDGMQELGTWRRDDSEPAPLAQAEVERARRRVDATVVCQLLDTRGAAGARDRNTSVVWLPLRANGQELGALVGVGSAEMRLEAVDLDTAAVLAAHVAASLDAAVVLEREKQSAVTDPLTGILNRRGLEVRLEEILGSAQERRVHVSLLVMDCDDFKDINDRAGHEFGDALLAEIARVLERALPEGAVAARLGGDEFVVVLPGASADDALSVGGAIRDVLREGLTEAGFPLKMSGGIATYPFDGATASMLVRAADQALYAAKERGKDVVMSFRDAVRRERPALVVSAGLDSADERRRPSGRGDGSVLAEAVEAAAAIEAEGSVDGVCSRLCKALVFVVGATACTASRIAGDVLVDASGHALREISLGEEAAYRISDFPLTSEVLESGKPHAISFLDEGVDPAEAFILRELDMNALLMVPLRVRGAPWGLVELYEMRLRRFTEDDVAVASFLTRQAELRLEAIDSGEAPTSRPPLYELPPGDASLRRPRTR